MTTACANDVLEMALGLERIGQNFYTALALASDDAKVRDFCFRAAGEEGRHFAAFQHLRQRCAARGRADRWISLAEQHVQLDARAVHRVALSGDIHAAAELAIRMEQDAIIFYESLVDQMPASAAVIHAIIAEERRHLSALQLLVP